MLLKPMRAAGFSGLPSYTIAPLRTALQAAGLSPQSIRDNGDFDIAQLASSVYDTVELRTYLTSPIQMQTAALLAPAGGPPNKLLQWLKPTVILSGRAGTQTIAPYGVAEENGGQRAVFGLGAFLFALFGLGFMAGNWGR